MKLYSRKMTKLLATDILSWKYEPPYDLYNNDVTDDAISELMNEGYIAVEDESGALVGFYCSGHSAQVPAGRGAGAYIEPAIDVGVGMHPELTGKGKGYFFFSFILNELEPLNANTIFRLTVAKFNKRAMKLYENMGFRVALEIKTENNEYLIMVKR